MITVSIVSHGHGSMVATLVQQLKKCPQVSSIVVTRNIPEAEAISPGRSVKIVRNRQPKGFGANHNAAFELCETPYYCVLNPDIGIAADPFPALLSSLEASGAALVAPLIHSAQGDMEDSIRQFPTLRSMAGKFFFGAEGRYPLEPKSDDFYPDWVGGMFMLLRADAFRHIGGFDESFYLYYEDVDLCARLWQQGYKVSVCSRASATHTAQRASRHNARHMRLHLGSMVRYFSRYWMRLPR